MADDDVIRVCVVGGSVDLRTLVKSEDGGDGSGGSGVSNVVGGSIHDFYWDGSKCTQVLASEYHYYYYYYYYSYYYYNYSYYDYWY